MSQTNPIIVIAGASSGIGAALASLYSENGLTVHACGRRPLPSPLEFEYSRVDTTDAKMTSDWIEEIDSIDLFIDCVGVLLPPRPFVEYSSGEIETSLDGNLRSKISLLRAVLPVFKTQQRGCYVSLASNPKGYPLKGLSLYALGKTSVEKLIETIAQEMKPPITLVSVFPGMVDTPMLRQSMGSLAGNYINAHDWASKFGNRLLSIPPKLSGSHVSVEELS